MLAWALRYAELGYHVFPCHEPLFDDPHGYLCTCEQYRHTSRCKEKHPHLHLEGGQHCANPGKHPRGLEHGLKQATNDAAQIRAWWTKYPNANIGCVPGRNGYAALDLDAWKESYAGADLLTRAEQNTWTVLTGGGGQHLWYRKHDGSTYSNAPGSLPAGLDVRADNGYVILPPSLHKSGNRYQWEDGYGPRDLEAQQLPGHIHDILIAASARTAKHSASFSTPNRWDGKPSTPEPDLTRWKLSVKALALLNQPAPKGKRSEADMRACVALLYGGAGDDDILAVFEHYPIGTAGKFAEGGRRYLERTISAAKTYAEEHPRPPNVDATIASARAWLHRIDLAEHVPSEKQAARGYMTRERDLAVADAALEVFQDYGSLEGPLGLRQLRRMTNLGGLSTVARALECLVPWFIRPMALEDDAAGDAAHRYELSCCSLGTPSIPGNVYGVPSEQQVYSELRRHDAFNATTTPITAAMLEEREYSTRYTLTAMYRRRLAAALPGAGRTALVIVASLVDAGGYMPISALVGLGGRSKHTISRAVSRLNELEFVAKDATGGVLLRDDWREWLDKVTELMPTHGNGHRRIVKDAIRTWETCDAREKEAKEAGTAAPGWVEKRRQRAQHELIRLAPALWRREYAEPSNAIELGHKRTQQNKPTLWDRLHRLGGLDLLTPAEYKELHDLSAQLGPEASTYAAALAASADVVGPYDYMGA